MPVASAGDQCEQAGSDAAQDVGGRLGDDGGLEGHATGAISACAPAKLQDTGRVVFGHIVVTRHIEITGGVKRHLLRLVKPRTDEIRSDLIPCGIISSNRVVTIIRRIDVSGCVESQTMRYKLRARGEGRNPDIIT